MNFKDYFQPYEHYFWQWEDDAEVVAIPNSSTIAYREFLIEIMSKLADQGLPPFGSLLLAVIAVNKRFSDLTVIYDIILERTDQLLKDRESVTNANTDLLRKRRLKIINESMSFLKKLSIAAQMISKEKQDARPQKIMLLQTIFQDSHHLVAKEYAKEILSFYSGNVNFQKYLPPSLHFNINVFNRDFSTISLLHEKFPDVDAILKKMADVPDLAQEAPKLDDKPFQVPTKKDFVEELIEEEETFEVGALIRHIWAGLTIPLHNTMPSQQPLGGVSDLTNKGDFDKLLISEFANEDLVFLLRLANNEALYLHREIPPMPNQLQRIMLMDASLKNWGTPKTIAFALLLAIARHPKTDISCLAYLVGKKYTPILFDTREQVIESQSWLSDALVATEGLRLFFKENKNHQNQEIIWIGAQESMETPAFQQTMEEFKNQFSYWLLTDAGGNIEVYKRQHQSKKHIQHILLPLEKLWHKEKKKTPPKEQNEPPLINEFPILFPVPHEVKRMLINNLEEKFVITNEYKLMFVSDMKKGLEMKYQSASASEYAIGKTNEGDDMLLMYQKNKCVFRIVNLTKNETALNAFSDWESKKFGNSFIFHSGSFFYCTNQESYIINSTNNQVNVKPFKSDASEYERVSYEEYSKKLVLMQKQQEVRLQELKKNFLPPPSSAILKNIDKIFVNDTFNLVFNTHTLIKNKNGVIKLGKTNLLTKRYEAVPNATKSEFTFPNGSSVILNRSGMIVLKSIVITHKEIDVNHIDGQMQEIYVFIPSVLDSSLGVGATGAGEEFAGNEFYYLAPPKGKLNIIKTDLFWQKYITTFIDEIIQYKE
jgi:hypothetical protein